MMPVKLQITVSRASLIFQKRFTDAVNTLGMPYIASTACTRSHIATTKQKMIISKIRKNILMLHPVLLHQSNIFSKIVLIYKYSNTSGSNVLGFIRSVSLKLDTCLTKVHDYTIAGSPKIEFLI